MGQKLEQPLNFSKKMSAATFQILPKIARAAHFSTDSKVWIYPISRRLTDSEAEFVENQLTTFCKNWTAHDQKLQATGEIFENRLVILTVDESLAGASGCSIDKSVHFLERLGEQLRVDFFDRLTFGWLENERVNFGNLSEFSTRARAADFEPNTLMLNTLSKNRAEILERFWMPFSESWHRRLV